MGPFGSLELVGALFRRAAGGLELPCRLARWEPVGLSGICDAGIHSTIAKVLLVIDGEMVPSQALGANLNLKQQIHEGREPIAKALDLRWFYVEWSQWHLVLR